MKLKRKLFSGYSESIPEAVTYKSAQILSDYVLDPVDNSVKVISNSPLGKVGVVEKKIDKFYTPVSKWRGYIKYRLKNKKSSNSNLRKKKKD